MASSFLIVRSSQPKGIQGRRRDLAVKSWLKRCFRPVWRMLGSKTLPGAQTDGIASGRRPASKNIPVGDVGRQNPQRHHSLLGGPSEMENARIHEKSALAAAEMGQSTPLPILVTKIQPPGRSSGLLDRPRLLALLPLLRSKQLTVIKAPAGFGKTSVAVAWAERLRELESKVAWLGLDQDDDVPGRLLYYAAYALQRACGGLGSSVIDMIAEISLLPIETGIS